MDDLRTILRDVVAEELPSEPVALLFSGGTDSLTILWTLLDLGAQVTCYTFHLSYFESTDARVSQKACAFWNVPQVVIHEDGRAIPEQLASVIGIIRSARKTHVEVMYGYYFLMEHITESHVYSGLQADTLYGSNKNAAIRMGKRSADEFAAYRRALFANPDQEGVAQARAMAGHFGKTLHAPYTDSRVRDFFLRYSWAQLNRPKQKMPALRAFSAEFRALPIYRFDDNFQCGSRLREHLAEYVKDYRRILAHGTQ